VVPAGSNDCSDAVQTLNAPFTYQTGGRYIFQVKLAHGSGYTLLFTAGNDPVIHSAPIPG
jgi:hypothetical protein